VALPPIRWVSVAGINPGNGDRLPSAEGGGSTGSAPVAHLARFHSIPIEQRDAELNETAYW